MNKINVKLLKSQLTINEYKKILDNLGIPVFLEDKNEIKYWTGDKNVNPYNGSPKLIFYKDTRVFCGFTSGATYDIISLTQKRLSLLHKPCSFIDAVNFILNVTGISENKIARNHNPIICNWQNGLEKFIRLRSHENIAHYYEDNILLNLKNIYYQEWLNEGISVETLIKYEIKWYERQQQIVIPCRDRSGNLIGIRCRNTIPESVEKAKYQPLMLLNEIDYRFNTNDYFYGISYNWASIEAQKSVILVEGEKSVLKADTFFGRNSNVLALFGSQLGLKRRNELINLGVKEVTLALDSDFHEIGDEDYKEFEQKIFKIASLFKGFAKVYVIYNNIGLKEEGYKASPFDFDIETFNKFMQNKEIIE